MSNSTSGEETFIMAWGAPGLGAVFSTLLASGPMAAVLDVRSTGSMGDVNPDPFPVLFANCIAWCMYGAVSRNHFLFAGNIPGVIFGLFYVLSTYGCSQAKIRKRIEIITFPLLTLVCFAGFAVTLLPPQYGVEILGYLGNGIVFVVFSSPLSTAVKVISTRNSASINRPFGIIQVFNCFIWCTYALSIHDVYLLVPNVFGLALGIAQVFLMILYPAVKSEGALLDDQEQPLDT